MLKEKNTSHRLITVVPYNDKWPMEFHVEAECIKTALGSNCIEIHHIGSTSVPGLAAKPIIDMIPVVLNIGQVDKAKDALQAIGYEAKGENGIPFRRYFQKGGNERTHQLHVFESTNPEIEHHLRFRDWMRLHPDDRDAYARLKEDLAHTFPHDIIAYCLGKEDFIVSIDKKAGFKGLRIVKALTNREWKAAQHLRRLCESNLFDPEGLTFDQDAHVHFVLYQGTEIIGYAHLQLWSENRSVLRTIVIDKAYRNHLYGSQFLALCENWLKSQGYQSLHVEIPQSALRFYKKNAYIDMPFNDPNSPDRNPIDMTLGKLL